MSAYRDPVMSAKAERERAAQICRILTDVGNIRIFAETEELYINVDCLLSDTEEEALTALIVEFMTRLIDDIDSENG